MSFKVYNPLQLLEESGLLGITFNDNAPAGPNVVWSSQKTNSIGMQLVPSAAIGNIAVFGPGGQIVDGGLNIFVKYSAPVQTLGTTASPILFNTIVGSSNLSNAVISLSVAAGVITITSTSTSNTAYEVTFNPQYISDTNQASATFQLQSPSGTNYGNPSLLSNNVTAGNNVATTGILNEFISVPPNSSVSIQVTGQSTSATTTLGSGQTLPYITIVKI